MALAVGSPLDDDGDKVDDWDKVDVGDGLIFGVVVGVVVVLVLVLIVCVSFFGAQ
jgi:hypothetical protein